VSYVPGFSNDIFVSFSHIDNQAVEGAVGWVSDFHQRLQIEIEEELGARVSIWRDPRIGGAEDFAKDIERQVRAFAPLPGAQTSLDGAVLKIWRARVERGVHSAPGTVSAAGADGIVVACGADALRITELQRAGGKRLAAQAFLSGSRLERGARLGAGDG